MKIALDSVVLLNFAIAMLIGALLGLEREKKKIGEEDVGIGGIRTFILISQAGAVSAWLGDILGMPWIFIASLLAVSAVVTAGYVMQASVRPSALGMTTEIAAIGVFLLGGACMLGHAGYAVVLGIVASAVLAYKEPMHELARRIGRDDLFAIVKLLLASFVVLPLLPDRPIDPWAAINPYKLWLLVVLISALSLVGYVAMRIMGSQRGAVVTGLAGGLVSSTVVTFSFSRNSRDEAAAGRSVKAMASGILLAWAVMFVRIAVAVAVVNFALVRPLFFPLAVMFLLCTALAAAYYRAALHEGTAAASGHDMKMKNPFNLSSAVHFALLFAVVLLVVKFGREHFAGQGMMAVAAIAGFTDVDAITLSMAGFARDGGDARLAAVCIAVAALSNTIVKCGFAVWMGAPALKRSILIATAVILAGGAAAMVFV